MGEHRVQLSSLRRYLCFVASRYIIHLDSSGYGAGEGMRVSVVVCIDYVSTLRVCKGGVGVEASSDSVTISCFSSGTHRKIQVDKYW